MRSPIWSPIGSNYRIWKVVANQQYQRKECLSAPIILITARRDCPGTRERHSLLGADVCYKVHVAGAGVGEFNFQEHFDRVFSDPDASIDQVMDGLVEMFDQMDPAYLESAASLTDGDIEQAFLEFVDPGGSLSTSPSREGCFLTALLGAAEFKRRADRAGVTVLEYARLIRVRRELDGV